MQTRPARFALDSLFIASFMLATAVNARAGIPLLSRCEAFANAGMTQELDSRTYQASSATWLTLEGGAGYRLTPGVSLGVNAACETLGREGIIYFPPGDDFQSATRTRSMVPVRGTLTMRLPRIHRAIPYAVLQAGSSTFIERSHPAATGHAVTTRPILGASVGIAGDRSIAPRLQLTYETRFPDAYRGFLPDRQLHFFALSVGVGIRGRFGER